mgnify:CR=1 FL=1
MNRHQEHVWFKKDITLMLVLLNVAVLKTAFVTNDKWYWLLWLTIPLLVAAIFYKKGVQKTTSPSISVTKSVSPWQSSKVLPLNQSSPQPVMSSDN